MKCQGELDAAIKAICFRAVSDHGRAGAARRLGIGVRTLNGWLREWGVPARSRPQVDPSDVLSVAEYLGFPVVESVVEIDKPVPVPVVPLNLSRQIAGRAALRITC